MVTLSQDSFDVVMHPINQDDTKMLLRQLEIFDDIQNFCIGWILSILLLKSTNLKRPINLTLIFILRAPHDYVFEICRSSCSRLTPSQVAFNPFLKVGISISSVDH